MWISNDGLVTVDFSHPVNPFYVSARLLVGLMARLIYLNPCVMAKYVILANRGIMSGYVSLKDLSAANIMKTFFLLLGLTAVISNGVPPLDDERDQTRDRQ